MCKHVKIKIEQRKDKYGQNFKATCSCGKITSNWHTAVWKARAAFDQNHRDFIKGKKRRYTFKEKITCTHCGHVDYVWGGSIYSATSCHHCNSLAFGLCRVESCTDEEFFKNVCDTCDGDRFSSDGSYCSKCKGSGLKDGGKQ